MKRTFVSRKDFVKTRQPGAAIRKQFGTTVKRVGAEEQRTLEFCITTDAVDRHGDTVSASGWKTAAYLKNPVVLWEHDHRALPIARTMKILPFAHGLRAQAKFAPASMNPTAEQVYQMCRAGFLNAAIVGFIPLKYEEARDRPGFCPMTITEQELIEWSVVNVPANSEALQGKSAMLAEVRSVRHSLALTSETLKKALGYSVETGWTKKDIEAAFDEVMSRAGVPQSSDLSDLSPEHLDIVLNAVIDTYLIESAD